jgi:hypothetical protein
MFGWKCELVEGENYTVKVNRIWCRFTGKCTVFTACNDREIVIYAQADKVLHSGIKYVIVSTWHDIFNVKV